MRTYLIMAMAGAAGLLALAGAGPAAASCASSETTGTIVGGIGGALIGSAVGHTPGAFIGGLGGAVVGHEIGRSSCGHARYGYRYRSGYRYERRVQAPRETSNPGFYYDPQGRPIYVGSNGYAAAYRQPGGYGGACRNELREYYDATGALVQRTVQVCDR